MSKVDNASSVYQDRVKPIRIKPKNIYICIENGQQDKENKRIFLHFTNFDFNIKNSVNQHSELVLTGTPILKPEIISKTIQDCKGKFIEIYYKEKEKTNTTIKKVLFRGIVSEISTPKTNEYELTAKSITYLLDEKKYFIDFGTNFNIYEVLELIIKRYDKYIFTKEQMTQTKLDYYKLVLSIESEKELKDKTAEVPHIMYNSTYWIFIKRVLSLVKQPIYLQNGNQVKIGIPKLENENEEVQESELKKPVKKNKKLSFLENEYEDFLEIGDIYQGYFIYQSEIKVSTKTGTTIKYNSGNEEEVKNYIESDFENIRSNLENFQRLDGKVIDVTKYKDYNIIDKRKYEQYTRDIAEGESIKKKLEILDKKIEKLDELMPVEPEKPKEPEKKEETSEEKEQREYKKKIDKMENELKEIRRRYKNFPELFIKRKEKELSEKYKEISDKYEEHLDKNAKKDTETVEQAISRTKKIEEEHQEVLNNPEKALEISNQIKEQEELKKQKEEKAKLEAEKKDLENQYKNLKVEEKQKQKAALKKKSDRLGITVEFGEYFKNLAVNKYKKYSELEINENGTFKDPDNEGKTWVQRHYFPMIVNPGYSKGINLTTKYQKDEIIVIFFNTISESSGTAVGSLSEMYEELVMREEIKMTVKGMEISAENITFTTASK